MENKILKLIKPIFILIMFVLFTVAVKYVDVQAAGPGNTDIGFSHFNLWIFKLFGVHKFWYNLTDWLGLTGIFTAFVFAITGLVQLIKRKALLKVDKEILILGGLYLLIIGLYIFFEKVIINYRPILLGKNPEASYPSSHTMIVVTILGTALVLINKYIRSVPLYHITKWILFSIIIITVFGRTICGVHWATDIIGGLLLSWGLISVYKTLCDIIETKV